MGIYTLRPSRYLHDRAGWDGGHVVLSWGGSRVVSHCCAGANCRCRNGFSKYWFHARVGQQRFLGNLVTAETNLNTNILSSELTWEANNFGPNAFNGALDRFFNVDNLVVLTGEQTVNSFLGGTQVPALNAGVFLTGGGSGVINTNGGIGGLEGIFDQTLAAYVDLAG
jgi:hypothetical protein